MNTDFAVERPKFGLVLFKLCEYMTMLVAIPALLLALKKSALPFFYRMLIALGGALVVGAVVGGIVLGAIYVRAALDVRRDLRENPDLARNEAEKFYYLALWGALHRNMKFSRRMLKNAVRYGFRDKARLGNPKLRQALPRATQRILEG